MNAERARGESEDHGRLGLRAAHLSVGSRWRRTLSISSITAALFALSWIVACSDDTGDPTDAGGNPPVDINTAESTDCSMRAEVDKYSANMVKVGSTAVYKFQLVSSVPAPPGQAKHVWMLKILNASDGQAVMNRLPIVGETSMPDHMHPVPYQPQFMFDDATGVYTVTNVNFTLMPGRWKVRFSIPEAAGSDVIIDSASFDFCIE